MNNEVDTRSYTRRKFLSSTIKTGTAIFSTGLLPIIKCQGIGNYNVLFMIIDDLRPMLGCYGVSEMHTPKIDSFSRRGTLFNRAYCQYPLCNPSRASILTGLRPETIGVDNNNLDYKQTVPNAVDMMQHFMKHGYNTYTFGKVKHYPAPSTGGPTWNSLNVSDDDLSDGETAKDTVEFLSEIKDETFFLAVGFDKPHLPFNAPNKYFDLYKPNPFLLPPTLNYPVNSPTVAYNSLDTFRRFFSDIPYVDEPISEDKTLELIRAYAAATSYMDAQVGRVINQLDVLGLNENTVIVFCGDHGFHLGEHGTWRKNTLYEIGVRSPFLISIPGQQPCQTNSLSELVDIYPTLCDACDIPIPDALEGLSLLPVIEDPTRQLKSAAFSIIARSVGRSFSMRTDTYRYTEWGKEGDTVRELYDYDLDPNETTNIAVLPENAELVEDLSQQLRSGWKAAIYDAAEYITIPRVLPWDVNNDGIVNIQDLIIVSNNFGEVNQEYPKADVNKDDIVDILDLLYVAAHFGESCITSAPPISFDILPNHYDSISEWLTAAYQTDDGSDIYQKGIVKLESLLNFRNSDKTKLYQNFPNPFNPETWIPYDLKQDADVNITIYNLKGEKIRDLKLGFQNAGSFRTKDRAAYWDGRNYAGEHAASGVYFYHLKSEKRNLIRQMTIVK